MAYNKQCAGGVCLKSELQLSNEEFTNRTGGKPNQITPTTGIQVVPGCRSWVSRCVGSASIGMCRRAMFQYTLLVLCTILRTSWSQDRSSSAAFFFSILRSITALLASCHGYASSYCTVCSHAYVASSQFGCRNHGPAMACMTEAAELSLFRAFRRCH